jgi:hypothetical protein
MDRPANRRSAPSTRRWRQRAAAAATGPVQLALAAEWDKQRFSPAPDLVVLETVTEVPPESWVRVVLDEALRSPAGPATPGVAQE